MGTKEENVVDKLQSEARLIWFRKEEVLFEEIHEKVSIWSYGCTHGDYLVAKQISHVLQSQAK